MNLEERFVAGRERQKNGDSEGAAMLYQSVLNENPEHSGALNNLASMLKMKGVFQSALVLYRRALSASPEDADIMHNLSHCLLLMERYKEAETVAMRAAIRNPRKAEYRHKIALARHGGGEDALEAYNLAAELAPNTPEILWDRSLFLLSIGDYENGWKDHDARLDWRHPNIRKIPLPMWNGEDLTNKTIWVYSDQGLGDAIMCVRYIPELAKKAGKVILDARPEQRRLFSQFHQATIRNTDEPMPEADYHIPLTSLPSRFKVTLQTIDGKPYLSAASTFLPNNDNLKVGLVWAGLSSNPKEYERSMPFDELFPLCEIPGIDFYSFLKGERAREVSIFGANPFIKDISPFFSDMADTAAYMNELDLLISVDTGCAHLGGALGVPTWLLLPYSPDWRWGFTGNRTPWYDSMRLFRQSQPKMWGEVVRDVHNELMIWKETKENRYAVSALDHARSRG